MISIPRLPPLPRATGTEPGPIRPASWNAMVDAVQALEKGQRSLAVKGSPDIAVRPTPDGYSLWITRRPDHTNTIPPLWVRAGAEGDPEAPDYYVTVTPGYVYELLATAGEAVDAMVPHKVPETLDVDGNLTQWPITDGDNVYVKVLEDNYGAIGGSTPVEIVIASTATSLNYIPETQDGVYYYKLAEFSVDAGYPTITPVAMGSHIYRRSGLTCDAVVEDCSGDPMAEPPTLNAQLLRLSFLSGVVVAIGASLEDRPYADSKQVTSVTPCS